MSNIKINEAILTGIRENSGDDTAVYKFLIQLVYEEADRSGTWWWTDTYRRLLDKWSEQWSEVHEN